MKHDGWGSRRHERLRSFCRLLDRDAHKSFRKNSDFPVWVYLEALDRDHRQVYEAPSIGMLLCKNCGHDVEECFGAQFVADAGSSISNPFDR